MRKPVYFASTAFFTLTLVIAMSWNNIAATVGDTSQEATQVQSPRPAPPLHPKNPPKIVEKVQPTYPAEAREKRVQGIVVLHVVIDQRGEPDSIRVLSGDPLLTPAAVEAVRQWRWEPLIMNKKPVAVSTNVTVNFKLDNKRKAVN